MTITVPPSTDSGERIHEASRADVIENTGGEDVAAGGVGAVEPPVVEGLAVGQVRAEPWCSARAMDAAGGAMTLGSGLAARRRSLSPSLSYQIEPRQPF